MLAITVPKTEAWDDEKQEFVYISETTLCLEHSLVALSKWESKWQKPFLTNNDKTHEETLDYIKYMTMNDGVPPEVYHCLTNKNYDEIYAYLAAPMTATTFSDDKTAKGSREIVTSELIYYWMIAMNIPMECQHWHLNRLLTLIKVCSIKNAPSKKMSKKEVMSRNRALNEARKHQMGISG